MKNKTLDQIDQKQALLLPEKTYYYVFFLVCTRYGICSLLKEQVYHTEAQPQETRDGQCRETLEVEVALFLEANHDRCITWLCN